MLNTSEIIDLCDKEQYDMVISNLNISEHNYRSSAERILVYAITHNNIDLIVHLFSPDNMTNDIISHIISNPNLYPTLEFMLSTNTELCKSISKILPYVPYIQNIPKENNTQLLNIIIKYLSTNKVIRKIIANSISNNNLNIIDILFENNYDIKSVFSKILHPCYLDGTPITTFISLQKYGIDMNIHINKISKIILNTGNDTIGIKYCLENGADPNYIIRKIKYRTNLNITKCILQYIPDINSLDAEVIIKIGGYCNDVNLEGFHYLVNSRLDASKYMYDLIYHFILYDTNNNLEKLINLGYDIPDINNLFFISVRSGRIECAKILLKNGADIHMDNNVIILFIDYDIPKLELMHPNLRHCSHSKWFAVAKFLIDSGAIINDIQYTFCLYVARLNNCKYHEELFTHFLNMGVDLDAKFDLTCKKNMADDIHITYILEAIVYAGSIELLQLCLKYGANLHINNFGSLHTAIWYNKLDIVKFLLDVDSIVDPNFECNVTTEMIDLLDQYQIPHKLKKIDKISD